MIRPVPFILRVLLALVLIVVADTLHRLVVVLDAVIRWIMPEVDDGLSDQEGASR